MSRYDLTDLEWRLIEPLLPDKPRGVARVDDRRVLNGIVWVRRSGALHLLQPLNRWRTAGVWDRLMDTISAAHDGADIRQIAAEPAH